MIMNSTRRCLDETNYNEIGNYRDINRISNVLTIC